MDEEQSSTSIRPIGRQSGNRQVEGPHQSTSSAGRASSVGEDLTKRQKNLRRYNHSAKGKSAQARYDKTEKGRDNHRRYLATARGQELLRERRQRQDAKRRGTEERWRSQRNAHLKRLHGVTLSFIESMLADQGSKCAACGDSLELRSNRTHLDHHHASGKVRAILCHHCNTALGLMKEDVRRLLQLIAYIEKYEPH